MGAFVVRDVAGPQYIYPHQEIEAYPVLAGPPAFYPAEAPGEPYEAFPVGEHMADMQAAASAGDWTAYFRALGMKTREARAEAQRLEAAAPAPEWTTRDGWPEGFPVPAGARALVKRAEAAGWEVRVGYSRPFRAGVRKGEWVKAHYVGVWARKGGRSIYGRWWAKADAEKLTWSWDKGSVNGWHAEKVGMLTDAIEAARDHD